MGLEETQQRGVGKRVTSVTLAMLIILSVATGLLVGARSGGATATVPPVGDGSIETLDRPASAKDTLPTALLRMPTADWLSSPNAARLVVSDTGYRAWVAPGDNGFICLVIQIFAEGTTGLSCAPRKTLETAPIYISSVNPQGGVDLIGIVDDAVRSVRAGDRSAIAKDNAFLLKHMQGNQATLVTAAQSQTVDLGPLTDVDDTRVMQVP
jgi:hypothetical protein